LETTSARKTADGSAPRGILPRGPMEWDGFRASLTGGAPRPLL
jgi:hypothetical protein